MTEPRPQLKHTGNFVKFGHVMFIQPVVKPCLSNRFDKHGLTAV